MMYIIKPDGALIKSMYTVLFKGNTPLDMKAYWSSGGFLG